MKTSSRRVFRRSVVALSAISVLCAPVQTASAGTPGIPGPFVGVVGEGDVDRHSFNNNPVEIVWCLATVATYHVELDYVPASDQLTLRVNGLEDVGVEGKAEIVFVSGLCTSFQIEVRGTNVATDAGYVVHVWCEQHLPVEIEYQLRCF